MPGTQFRMKIQSSNSNVYIASSLFMLHAVMYNQ
jgi:hypothetical protein